MHHNLIGNLPGCQVGIREANNSGSLRERGSECRQIMKCGCQMASFRKYVFFWCHVVAPVIVDCRLPNVDCRMSNGKVENGCRGGVRVRRVESAADGADFEALGAAESPVASGDTLDERFFDDALRLKPGDEVGEEGVEIGLALGGVGRVDDDVLGEEAVLEGVAGGAGFAFRRLGAGGLLDVTAVGGAFFVGNGFGHG